jgi:hypothetical protein
MTSKDLLPARNLSHRHHLVTVQVIVVLPFDNVHSVNERPMENGRSSHKTNTDKNADSS